jgi:ribosome-associated protein
MLFFLPSFALFASSRFQRDRGSGIFSAGHEHLKTLTAVRQFTRIAVRPVPRDNHPMLRINDDLWIDEDDLRFEFARSSGPGGQNVNKVETKVRLLFDLQGSRSLSSEQRTRVEERLATRITKAGVLHISSQRHRTREANRKATIERFIDLLAEALEEDEPRVRTRVPKKARKRRLESKRRRSQKKAMRSRPGEED